MNLQKHPGRGGARGGVGGAGGAGEKGGGGKPDEGLWSEPFT